MATRWYLYVAAVLLLIPSSVASQTVVPHTPWGDPDLQGVWATEFLTMLERPQHASSLVATPDEARALAGALLGGAP